MSRVKQLIDFHQLLPHPEGGFYKETYRSKESISGNALPERFGDHRSCSTAIYFLLERGDFSAFHKIKSDECWHFYDGKTLLIHVLHEDGYLETVKLGNNFLQGEIFQFIVPANCWFASEPDSATEFSFVGCTVAPGFDFSDFELASSSKLLMLFPQHENIIKRLCRE